MLIIGLNPSTADASNDDATIRRCVHFAKVAGCSSLAMANLFAARSTDPKALSSFRDPIGPENDRWLANLYASSNIRVAAWGAWGYFLGRGEQVARQLPNLLCFGVTSKGFPRHPLYLANNTQLVPLVGG